MRLLDSGMVAALTLRLPEEFVSLESMTTHKLHKSEAPAHGLLAQPTAETLKPKGCYRLRHLPDGKRQRHLTQI